MKNGWRLITGMILALCLGARAVCASGEWKELSSRHFIVYYKETSADFAKAVSKSAEDYFQAICRDLGFVRYKGWDFDGRAKIYIYNDKDDYLASSRQANWSAGVAYYNRRTIKTFPAAAGFFDSLLPHELGHIIFYEFIGNPRVRIPLWFDEGVAMYQEKAQRWGSHQTVKKALNDGTFIALDDLSRVSLNQDSPPELVKLFYAEAASAVYFLIKEHGEFRFLNFCRQLRDGNTFERSLEISYPHLRTLKIFNDAWITYLKRL